MKDFLLKHSEKILGVLSGFDRLIFRGSIRQLMYEKGMSTYLSIRGILLKEFKDYARYYSAEFRFQTEKYAQANNRPFIWLPSAMVTKKGTQLISAIKTIQNTNLSNLLKLAA